MVAHQKCPVCHKWQKQGAILRHSVMGSYLQHEIITEILTLLCHWGSVPGICNNIRLTLLPGLGPRFLGILMGSRAMPGLMLCGPNADPFWLQGPVTLVFLRPGLRPLWTGGLPTVGAGCMAGLSTLPSVNAPRLLGNTTVWAKIDKQMYKKGTLSEKQWDKKYKLSLCI